MKHQNPVCGWHYLIWLCIKSKLRILLFVCIDCTAYIFLHQQHEFVRTEEIMWMTAGSTHTCPCICAYGSKRMWPWIWSAVAVFTRPKEQRLCVIRAKHGNRACPKHSWHQGTARWAGNQPRPFWLMWERAWETGRNGATMPCTALLLPRRCMYRRGRSTTGPNVSLLRVCLNHDMVDDVVSGLINTSVVWPSVSDRSKTQDGKHVYHHVYHHVQTLSVTNYFTVLSQPHTALGSREFTDIGLNFKTCQLFNNASSTRTSEIQLQLSTASPHHPHPLLNPVTAQFNRASLQRGDLCAQSPGVKMSASLPSLSLLMLTFSLISEGVWYRTSHQRQHTMAL